MHNHLLTRSGVLLGTCARQKAAYLAAPVQTKAPMMPAQVLRVTELMCVGLRVAEHRTDVYGLQHPAFACGPSSCTEQNMRCGTEDAVRPHMHVEVHHALGSV